MQEVFQGGSGRWKAAGVGQGLQPKEASVTEERYNLADCTAVAGDVDAGKLLYAIVRGYARGETTDDPQSVVVAHPDEPVTALRLTRGTWRALEAQRRRRLSLQ
jgi:hypothetical protein